MNAFWDVVPALGISKMLDTVVDINDVFLVVDDRDKVVKMWRDLGLNTFQVAPGDF